MSDSSSDDEFFEAEDEFVDVPQDIPTSSTSSFRTSMLPSCLDPNPNVVNSAQYNKDVEKGEEIFFMENDFEGAEQYFEDNKDKAPIFTHGWAALAFLRAAMTFQENDMTIAIQRLDDACSFAARDLEQDDTVKALAVMPPTMRDASDTPQKGSSSSSSSSSSSERRGSWFSWGQSQAAQQEVEKQQWEQWCQRSPEQKKEDAQHDANVLHNRLITGETKLLTGMLQFLQENLVSYAKGGINMRNAWKIYGTLRSELQHALEAHYPPGDDGTMIINELDDDDLDNDDEYNPHGMLDYSVEGGIHFGVGTFNLVTSTLPPIVLKIVKFFGFPADRDTGFFEVVSTHKIGGIRGPLATLLLSCFYIIIPSFFSLPGDVHLFQADEILEDGLSLYPQCALYHWFNGRLERLKGNIDQSIDSFKHAMQLQPDWAPLQHLGQYELAWCHIFNNDWLAAIPALEQLADENDWSKVFYMYAHVVCIIENNPENYATEAWPILQAITALPVRKFGGRVLSVEQYVFRKIESYCTAESCSMLLPGIELIYLWNGFAQMNKESLEVFFQQVEAAQENFTESDDKRQDEKALLLLLRGVLLKRLGRYDESKDLLTQAASMEKQIQEEKWIAAFAWYEMAYELMTSIAQAEQDELGFDNQSSSSSSSKANKIDKKALCKDIVGYLKKAKKVKNVNFEVRLHLRIHLASDRISIWMGEDVEEELEDDDGEKNENE